MEAFTCAISDCTSRELIPVECPACAKNFCLKHRHKVDHNCSKMEIPQESMQRTRQHIKEIISKIWQHAACCSFNYNITKLTINI